MRLPDVDKASLLDLISTKLSQALELVGSLQLPRVVPFSTINAVETLCGLLGGLLAAKAGAVVSPRRLERLFLFAALWSFGLSLIHI